MSITFPTSLWFIQGSLIVDFFKELPQFIVKVSLILSNLYGADWEKRLESREDVSLCRVYRKLKGLRAFDRKPWPNKMVEGNQLVVVHHQNVAATSQQNHLLDRIVYLFDNFVED